MAKSVPGADLTLAALFAYLNTSEELQSGMGLMAQGLASSRHTRRFTQFQGQHTNRDIS